METYSNYSIRNESGQADRVISKWVALLEAKRMPWDLLCIGRDANYCHRHLSVAMKDPGYWTCGCGGSNGCKSSSRSHPVIARNGRKVSPSSVSLHCPLLGQFNILLQWKGKQFSSVFIEYAVRDGRQAIENWSKSTK